MRRLKVDAISIGGEDARLAQVDLGYTTHGELDGDGSNCIVLPTYYTGNDESYLPWIGPDRPFDTNQWFVVVPNMIGNGRSTARDAYTHRSWDPRTDPVITIADNVAVQKLLVDRLGVRHVALVAGWSVGGLQAYQWAVSHGDLVGAILPVCASARCWPLNGVFLDGVAAFLHEALRLEPDRRADLLAAYGRAYAGWAYSAEYFRDELWRADGFASLGALLDRWAQDHVCWDPADLLLMLQTWRNADPARAGDTLEHTLNQITARAIVMPSTTDMYFTVAENRLEVSWQANAELRPIDSAHGHVAGRPGLLAGVTEQLRLATAELLGR